MNGAKFSAAPELSESWLHHHPWNLILWTLHDYKFLNSAHQRRMFETLWLDHSLRACTGFGRGRLRNSHVSLNSAQLLPLGLGLYFPEPLAYNSSPLSRHLDIQWVHLRCLNEVKIFKLITSPSTCYKMRALKSTWWRSCRLCFCILSAESDEGYQFFQVLGLAAPNQMSLRCILEQRWSNAVGSLLVCCPCNRAS